MGQGVEWFTSKTDMLEWLESELQIWRRFVIQSSVPSQNIFNPPLEYPGAGYRYGGLLRNILERKKEKRKEGPRLEYFPNIMKI